MSPVVEMLVAIGVLAGLVLAPAITVFALRARRRREQNERRESSEQEARVEDGARGRNALSAWKIQNQFRTENLDATPVTELDSVEDGSLAAQTAPCQAKGASQQEETEARLLAEREAQRQAEEARLRAEELAQLTAKQEEQLQDEQARRKAQAEARLAAEREAQGQADDARRRAEELAQLATKEEEQRQAEQAHQKAEAEARLAAERETQYQADEARRRAEEVAQLGAKEEAQRKADVARSKVEEEERVVVEREANREGSGTGQPEATQTNSKLDDHRPSPKPDVRAPIEREIRREQPNSAASHPQAPELVTETIAGDAGNAIAPLPSTRKTARRQAPQYRPPAGTPAVSSPPTADVAARGSGRGAQQAAATERSVPIELRVLFDRGGSCRVSLLPKRPTGLPEECDVITTDGSSLQLVALEDEWYQDVAPENLGALLQEGALWTDLAMGHEWVLAGRSIFVLAAGTTHRGFVTHPRFTLGREHLVLCATGRLPDVERALKEAGCTTWTAFQDDDGVPVGWVLLGDTDKAGRPRGVVPTIAVPMEENADILNVLRPRPEIEISLEGGVPLGYGSWLAGHPPAIQVLGDPQHTQTVLIDGKEATLADDGVFRAVGWDRPGSHQIWCSSVSRSYSLVLPQPAWSAWPAYVFPSAASRRDQIGICGALVRPLASDDATLDTADWFEARDVLLQSNPILLGAVPGQMFVAIARQDVRGALCFARPPFAAIWALPAQPLQCDKATNRILLLGGAEDGAVPDINLRGSAVSQWCRLILDAGRKGLSVEPTTANDLWGQYKRLARDLWRRTR